MPTPLHIICGKCGDNEMLSYSAFEDYDDENEKTFLNASISCGNCGTLTYLDEVIERKSKS